jgi:hypothetical protein
MPSSSDNNAEPSILNEYKLLNKKYLFEKTQLINDLINLKQLKNCKKLKILKQKRQIQIQKMKILDACLVSKSLGRPNANIVFPSIVKKYEPAHYSFGVYDDETSDLLDRRYIQIVLIEIIRVLSRNPFPITNNFSHHKIEYNFEFRIF